VQRCVQLAPPAEAEAEVVEVVEREEGEGLESGGVRRRGSSSSSWLLPGGRGGASRSSMSLA